MSCKEGLAINRALLAWKAATCKCPPLRREAMNEEWKEIPIEDVQPGDVARCNGREFPVVAHYTSWSIGISCTSYMPPWDGFEKLGFTFWRKVNREPRTCACESGTIDSYGKPIRVAVLPYEWPINMRVRVTEILPGEDGA